MASPAQQKTPPPKRQGKEPAEPPGAPLKAKRPPEKHVAWADFVDGMETMPLEQASALTPRDIGVQFGPAMDEAQFAAYRKARGGNVRILR